jgi:hypothetical protein
MILNRLIGRDVYACQAPDAIIDWEALHHEPATGDTRATA